MEQLELKKTIDHKQKLLETAQQNYDVFSSEKKTLLTKLFESIQNDPEKN